MTTSTESEPAFRPEHVVVVGLWHQGVVGAACLADIGHTVCAIDSDPHKIAQLARGEAPLFEPGLNELLRKGIESGRLQFTTDFSAGVRASRRILVMHDTPVNDQDECDLSSIFSTCDEMAPHLQQQSILLVTAQVPVGTCGAIADRIRAKRPDLQFTMAYSPENLRLGEAIARFMHPPLPVIGSDTPATLDALGRMLLPLSAKWERVSLKTAEMTKHALNTFLATCITFANELGNLCDEEGVDGQRLAQVLRLEPRIGPKAMLFPGLGFAGGTLARDVQTLRRLGKQHAVATPLLDGLMISNAHQNGIVLRKLKQALGDNLKGRRVAILGLTYKPDTSTLRRSAAVEIADSLHREGVTVHASDPKADADEVKKQAGFTFHSDPLDAVRGAEALVLMTPWKDYKALDFAKVKTLMANPLVIDTANLWDAKSLQAFGFTYLDIGRGRKASSSS